MHRFLIALSLFAATLFADGAKMVFLGGMDAAPNSAKMEAMIRNNFDVNAFRLIRVQVIPSLNSSETHLLVHLHAKGFHRVDFARVNLGAKGEVLSIEKNYELKAEDWAAQPGSKEEATCPDESTEFISFCPNDDDFEISSTNKVADTAKKAGLKTVVLLKQEATRQAYLNYMVCPKLKGNFYDGDANPSVITVSDGTLSSEDVQQVLKDRFRKSVTNIWVACQAYNDPMLSSVVDVAQAQKYAAGVNDLQVGPSDDAAVCAMQAAVQGQPMKQAFDDCYQKYDNKADHWGYGGGGSDLFGH